jgi:hypothetical protein
VSDKIHIYCSYCVDDGYGSQLDVVIQCLRHPNTILQIPIGYCEESYALQSCEESVTVH